MWASTLNTGLINKGWYGMFVASLRNVLFFMRGGSVDFYFSLTPPLDLLKKRDSPLNPRDIPLLDPLKNMTSPLLHKTYAKAVSYIIFKYCMTFVHLLIIHKLSHISVNQVLTCSYKYAVKSSRK